MEQNINKPKKLSSAISIYQKYETNQITYNELSRSDLHFKFKDGSDIIIEETDLHTTNPFKFTIRDLLDWSTSAAENTSLVLQNYSDYFNKLKNNYDNLFEIRYRPYFESDGFDTSNVKNLTDADKIIDFCRKRIHKLRKTDESIEAQAEIEHRRKNIFEVLYCINNRNLDNPKVKLYHTDLALTNQVTILQSIYEEEPKPNGEKHTPYEHKQRTYTIGEVIELLSSKRLNEKSKQTRPLCMPGTTGNRIVGEIAYNDWSGLQIFDLDLKNSTEFNKHYTDASEIRDTLYHKLKKYPWFLGICLSSSGRGLHVFTKVSRMHHLTDNDEFNAKIQKYWYRMSYYQKHSIFAYLLYHDCKITDIYSNLERDENNKRKAPIIDSAAARIQQGIALNYDPESKWSRNFIDLYPTFLYHLPPEDGIELEDWILHPKLMNAYTSWFYDNEKNNSESTFEHKDSELKIIVDHNQTVDSVSQIDMNSLNKGERYSIRWRVCNTIAYAYGDVQKTYDLCHHILQSQLTNTENTINSFIRSAILNNKQADEYTVKTLRKLGLKLTFDEETIENLQDESVNKIEYMLKTNDYIFENSEPDINVKLEDNEYLGMKMNHILRSLRDFKVNIIESAPNTGKTEFFKALAKKKKVCLVIPFTSTIESKIVNDKSMTDIFDIYYGDKSVSKLKRGKSCVMTFDKFSTLPKSKYKFFDYIAIDESHLCFTSLYRLPVVSRTIENIRNFLEIDSIDEQSVFKLTMSIHNALKISDPVKIKKKESTKFIMMSGTLTGEVDYFRFYGLLNYIKVHKKHPYKKKATFVLCKSSDTKKLLISESIAKAIQNGHKVIHPTNKGDTYAKQIVAGISRLLKREIKYEYYKRANNDEVFVEDINKETTTNDIDLLFCSDYLSVGIDIKDKENFTIIFDNDFTAESIEQFNNRLRSTDIECQIFYDLVDDSGTIKPNIFNLSKIEYVHNDELARMIIDEETVAKLQKSIKISTKYHAILGEMFSKYFIQDYTGKIVYVKAAFEIEQFEKQYTNIAKSLLYVKTSLAKKYQYEVNVQFKEEFSDSVIDEFKSIHDEARQTHLLQKDISFRSIVNFIADQKNYLILKNNNYITVKDSLDLENDDLGLHIGFDQNLQDGVFVFTWNKNHKYVIEHALKFTMKMRKFYSQKSLLQILDLCSTKSGLISKIELKRYRNLMKLIFSDQSEILSDNTKEILEVLYESISPESKNKLDRFEWEEIKYQIKMILNRQLVELTETNFESERRKTDIDNSLNSFVDTLFRKRVNSDNVFISFRKIMEFDSETIKSEIERDKIYRRILLNDNDSSKDKSYNETTDISEAHIGSELEFRKMVL